jgi:hypothetical protein
MRVDMVPDEDGGVAWHLNILRDDGEPIIAARMTAAPHDYGPITADPAELERNLTFDAWAG